jgi:hypothetical protein
MEKQKLTTNIPQDEVVIAYLEHERELWLPLHARAVRAGGMNAEFNAAEAEAMGRIDRLLDELSALAIKGTAA